MTVAIATAVGVVLLANLLANRAVARSLHYSRGQKIAQSLLIWFIPLCGALAVWLILRQMSHQTEVRPEHFPPSASGDGYSQGPSLGSDGGGDGGGK